MKVLIGTISLTLTLTSLYGNIGVQEVISSSTEKGTIYISPDGKGIKCTKQEPCNIMVLDESQKDITVKAGDTVFFRGGIYNYSMKNIRRIYLQGGTQQKPVTYESYPGELAIFDGSQLSVQEEEKKEWREGRLELHGNYIHFRKIEVRNMPQYGLRVFGNYNVVEGCTFHHNHLSGIEILNNIDGYSHKDTAGSYNLIQNNIVHNNSDENLQYGNYNLGGNADGITIHSGVQNILKNNTVYENSDDGIDTYKSMNSLVNYNLVYGNGKGDGNANGIKLGGADNKLGLNAIAHNNITYANKGFGITVHGRDNNITVTYNTSYDNQKAGYAILNDTTLNYNIAYQNLLGSVVWSKGKEQKKNSWQMSKLTPSFISFNINSKNFLKPKDHNKLQEIGAYALKK